MTREYIKQLLPVLAAFADGKAIQFRIKSHHAWSESDDMAFDRGVENYRIKPEAKLRAWKPEEVPVGATLKHGSWQGGSAFRTIISGANADGIGWLVPDRDGRFETGFQSYRDLANDYRFEHSTDGGKTWLPCGVLE